MDVQVIGAGFGRTGTLSMKAALEQLGFGPCHHMLEVFARPEDAAGWAAVVRGELDSLDQLLDGFGSCVDFPACTAWEPLWRARPGSKVLLTVRPAADWWKSFDATIGREIQKADHELAQAISEVVFGGRADDEATAVAAYEAHNAHVIETVPAEQLCVYQVGSGWEPLCEFLGVDVPDDPFPRSNSTQEFLEMRGAQGD
ncbi:MAG: sulfotransferase [Acidimicrobiales bacterium]